MTLSTAFREMPGVRHPIALAQSPQKQAGYAKAARLKAREANRRKDWCENRQWAPWEPAAPAVPGTWQEHTTRP